MRAGLNQPVRIKWGLSLQPTNHPTSKEKDNGYRNDAA